MPSPAQSNIPPVPPVQGQQDDNLLFTFEPETVCRRSKSLDITIPPDVENDRLIFLLFVLGPISLMPGLLGGLVVLLVSESTMMLVIAMAVLVPCSLWAMKRLGGLTRKRCLREKLHFGETEWTLLRQMDILPLKDSPLSGKLKDLIGARLVTYAYVNDCPQTQAQLLDREMTHVLASFRDARAKNYIVSEINKYLEEIRGQPITVATVEDMVKAPPGEQQAKLGDAQARPLLVV